MNLQNYIMKKLLKAENTSVIRISIKLLEYLKSKGKFGETYEEVIWKLIKGESKKDVI